MWVTLITLCLATTVYARPEIIIPEERAVELQALAEPALAELEEYLKEAKPEELNRKKKQITTFCVEIRSNEHRPFEICQPARSGSEKIKPEESEHSGAETHSKPAYPPVKTYQSPESAGPPSKQQFDDFRPNFPEVQNLGPARAAKENEEMQAENEIPSTGAAKSDNEEIKFVVPALSRSAFDIENEQKEDEKLSPARAATNPEPVPDVVNDANKAGDEINPETAKDAPKEVPKDELKGALKDAPENAGDKPADTNLQETVKDNIEDSPSKMRADEHNDAYHHKDTYHHDDTYNHKPSYGHPTSYIPVTPTHNSHHSGLVITCQPNLAGYAHGVPASYYHHEGHPSYNYRSASVPHARHYPYRPQYGGYQSYGSYGNYGGYNKQYQPRPMYRPQAQSYQGPVYPYQHSQPHSMGPMHHKPIQTHKPMDNQKFFSQQQKFDSQQAFESPDLSEPGPSPAFFPQHNREVHHERSSDVMDEVNKIDMKPLDQETKEQHTLQKIENMSKERLAEHWVPEGMEEVILAGEAREAVDEAPGVKEASIYPSHIGDPKAAEKKEEGPIPAFSAKEADGDGWRSADYGPPLAEHEHSGQNGAKEAEGGGWRSADFNRPPTELEPSSPSHAKEAEGGGWRSADYGPPPAEHEHSSHNGAKEAEGGGWRSADFDRPPAEHEPSSHNHAEGEGWRSAGFDRPPIGHSSHNHAKEAEGGGWRSADFDRPPTELEPASHNHAEGEGWRSADFDRPPIGDSSHNEETEGGGWRSASEGNPAHGNEHLTHNAGAMESGEKRWRNANDEHPVHGNEQFTFNGDAKEAEGAWRNAGHQQDVPLTHDVGGWREAEVGVPNEKLFNHPNGEMRNNQEDTSRGMLENKSAENRIE